MIARRAALYELSVGQHVRALSMLVAAAGFVLDHHWQRAVRAHCGAPRAPNRYPRTGFTPTLAQLRFAVLASVKGLTHDLYLQSC
jgi:hypothetical protein